MSGIISNTRNAAWSSMEFLSSLWNSTELLFTWNYRIQLFSVCATLLIVIATIASAVLTNRKDRLDQISGRKADAAIADANERASKAEAKSAEANKKAAEANAAAAGMNAQARRFEAAAQASALETARIQNENIEIQRSLEQERTARIALESKMAPRILSANQQAQLRDKWNRMKDLRLTFWTLPSHEPADFARQLMEIASGAGIKFGHMVRMIPVQQRGVVIGTPAALDATAKALALALMESGVAGVQLELVPNSSEITVHVLEKP